MKHVKLFENFINEAAVKGSNIVKIMQNPEDWGDDMKNRVYTKGNNMVFLDTFFYGEEKALNSLIKSWSPGGHYYDYFTQEINIEPKIEDSFSEFKATGRHKKLTTDGVIGVELSFKKI